MLGTLIKGCTLEESYYLPPLDELIKKKYNIDINTKKPIDVQVLSERVGFYPSILVCAMLAKQPKCSLFGVNCLIEVLTGVAGEESIIVGMLDYRSDSYRPFNFTLSTHGFLMEELELVNEAIGERNQLSVVFTFTPEYNQPKLELREQDNHKGSFDLDLKIEMDINIFADSPDKNPKPSRIKESILIASVIVEFDGFSHLRDEQVRSDKLRDSMLQSQGSTVFRVQTPYKHEGKGSTAKYRESLTKLLNGQVEDIKNHFRNRLFDAINANYLLKLLSRINSSNQEEA